jgi:3-deoxy-D-manno-octulosonic-acid transferase
VKQADCLIIDCYGLLSSIYRYGEMAYIGGGFGVSIHNVPEAAVYGIPVLFGPNNKKFMEAQQLKACEGAFEVSGAEDFNTRMDAFLSNRTLMKAAGERAGRYISEHAGAMEKIMKAVKL